MAADLILVYVTASSRQEAEQISRTAVDERLAACANILGRIRSIYRWRQKIEHADEWAFLLKTQAACWPSLEARIRALHSYDVPCIVAVPVKKGHNPFLQWVRTETRCRRTSLRARKRKR